MTIAGSVLSLRNRVFATILDAVSGLVGSFDESMVVSDPVDLRSWGAYYSRIQRYRLLWAMFGNNAYSDVHKWSKQFRKAYGLYAWTRNIYNPAYRLGDFYATHLMGGTLDPDAGDGRDAPSALPIDADSNAVRAGIAQLWRDSRWGSKKTVWNRWGAALGDVGLKVEEDVSARKLHLCPVNPASVRHVDKDHYGNIQQYVLEEWRPDPLFDWRPDAKEGPMAIYTETCERVGANLVFRTYRDAVPFDWTPYTSWSPGGDGIGDTWVREWPFVPMRLTQHIDVGVGWGWAEVNPSMSKGRECDDLGSILTDQGRRILNSPWVINARKPSSGLFGTKKTPAADEFSAGPSTSTVQTRDRMSVTWIDPAQNNGQPARPFQLVGNMPIDQIGQAIDRLLREMEKDHPELLLRGTESGDSGRARRIPRQQVEAKVQERRAAYDEDLAWIQAVALAIGGQNEWPGYEAGGIAAWQAGNLEHRVGKRPVFSVDPADEIEEETSRTTCIRTAAEADKALVPITMRRLGYNDADIAGVQKSIEEAKVAQEAAQEAKASAAASPQNRGSSPPLNPLGSSAAGDTQPTNNGQKAH